MIASGAGELLANAEPGDTFCRPPKATHLFEADRPSKRRRVYRNAFVVLIWSVSNSTNLPISWAHLQKSTRRQTSWRQRLLPRHRSFSKARRRW